MTRDATVMRSVGIIGRFTALSRVFGLLRDQLMAYHFGASLTVSAFYVAFRLPNLMRRLFGEGALSAAFVPVFSECLEQEGKPAAAQLAGRMLTFLGLSLGVLTALLWLGAGWVETHLPPDGRWAVALPLARIMLPYAILICLAALVMGMLNALGHFSVPAVAPVVLNLVWIAALILSRALVGDGAFARMQVLAWAIVLAGVLQLGIQLPVLRHAGLRLHPRFDFHNQPDVSRVLQLMAPAALGTGMIQINVFLDGVLAYIAAPWAPASLFFAERLVYLPLGLFATALGTVLLPTYSRQAALEDASGFRGTLRHALLNVIGLMTPAALLLLTLATPAVGLIFAWRGGEFGPIEIARTARALACYAPGLLTFSLYKAIVPAFYALKDTRTPVRIAVWGVVLNLGLNLLIVTTWPVEWRHAGMALSTVLSSAWNVTMLLRRLNPQPICPRLRSLGRAAFQALLISIVAGLVSMPLSVMAQAAVGPVRWAGKAAQLAGLFTGGVSGLLIYAAGIRFFCPLIWSVLQELWTPEPSDFTR